MKHKPDIFFDPPAIIIQDEASTYRKQLKQARKRQEERDMMHDAWLDNLFYGIPYKSLSMELFGVELTFNEFKKRIKGEET